MHPLPITHSTVAADALGREIARLWTLPGPVGCELLSRGVNDYYIVRSAGMRYAARLLRHGFRSPARIRYEADLSTFYRSRGFSVVAPLPSADGTPFHMVLAPEGPRALCLYAWLAGPKLSQDARPAVAQRLGAMVARMHEAASAFVPAEPVVLDIPAYFTERMPALMAMLEGRPDDARYYPALVERVLGAFTRIDPARVPRGPTHNDIHIDNVFVIDDRPVLFDWDNCGEDYFAKELNHFVWRNVYAGERLALNDAFLAGYAEVRPLNADERAAMPLFLLTRHLNILLGMAGMINIMGHGGVGYAHSLDRYALLIREAARDAGLS